MMTKRMYRYYEKRAVAAGTTVLVHLRREFHISSRCSLKVAAFASVKGMLASPGRAAS